MPSNAYNKFDKTIRRCESLVESYSNLHELSQGDDMPSVPRDIVRGAVVLGVSALDAYVTDVFTEKLVSYLKSHTPDEPLVELLYDAGLDTREALYLITMDRPFRRINTLIRSHYNAYTTQRFDVIDQLFLHYRLKNITENAQNKSGRKRLKGSVQKLIDRRHQIAHGGDYNKHGRIRDIDEKSIEKQLRDLETLVENMDEIICNRV